MTLRFHRRMRARRNGERGTAFLEAAMILPFLIAVMLACFELGMAWRAQMTVSNAARSGARVGSNVAKDAMADFSTLAAISAGLSSIDNATINWVTIYKVTGTSLTPPAACTSASAITAGGNTAANCNTYSAAKMAAVKAGDQTGFGDCTQIGAYDRHWCPTGRSIDQSTTAGPDTMAVAISITYTSFTKMFLPTRTIVDQFAMRLEPTGSLGASTP